MVKKILITCFVFLSGCYSDDLFSEHTYALNNYSIHIYMESKYDHILQISKNKNHILCLPGSSYIKQKNNYIIVKNDIRNIEPKYFLCDETDISRVQPEYILILESGDTCELVRHLDSLTILRKYPFVNLDMHSFF